MKVCINKGNATVTCAQKESIRIAVGGDVIVLSNEDAWDLRGALDACLNAIIFMP